MQSSTAKSSLGANATKGQLYVAAAPLIERRQPEVGHCLYVARAIRPCREGRPSFLYRRCTEGKIVEFE
jgi:hypothetical protein